jgi:hypothetical protein
VVNKGPQKFFAMIMKPHVYTNDSFDLKGKAHGCLTKNRPAKIN